MYEKSSFMISTGAKWLKYSVNGETKIWAREYQLRVCIPQRNESGTRNNWYEWIAMFEKKNDDIEVICSDL